MPEFSALYSVALWMCMILPLEMQRRGLVFGYIREFNCPVVFDFHAWVRENHGYVISFGTVYNFWYHPLEGSPAFILGYFYQFMMIAQSSMLYHTNHRNK